MTSPADPNVRPVIGWGWRNPFFRRFCRSRLRFKGMFISLLGAEMMAGFLFAICRAIASNVKTFSEEDIARAPIFPLLVLQGLVLFILGTAQAAGGMVAERDEGTIDYQRLAPMRPMSKVLGYLFGLPVREYVVVLATLPFTAWSMWKGNVLVSDWGPVYGVFFVTGLLYHLTGLVTGTVVKNRRWAFLVSIGLVFSLYTIIPQLAKFGLVFFHYLTMGPVLTEHGPGLVPHDLGKTFLLLQALNPVVKFFDLDFSETTFTLFSQGCLLITFLIMLRRRWKRHEAHLLGKLWAVVFFCWLQVLLLGNALPQVAHGDLFPTHGVTKLTRFRDLENIWHPEAWEPTALSALYGLATLGLILTLSGIITGTSDEQSRGWQRARKYGRRHLPFLSDEANGTWFTLVMALAGAVGWFFFTRGVVESPDWFPGRHLPAFTLGLFAAVLLAGSLGYQMLLEWKGSKAVGLAILLLGVAPMMVSAVVAALPGHPTSLAIWIGGMSPASLPVYAAQVVAPWHQKAPAGVETVPQAFYAWLCLWGAAGCWLLLSLIGFRRRMAKRILGSEVRSEPEVLKGGDAGDPVIE